MRSITVSPSATSPAITRLGGGAQVGRHHRRALQPLDALHHRGVALESDVGAQALQLEHVHEAVLEDGLGDQRGAVGDACERHELRLHVGGEAGVGRGAHADRAAAVRSSRSRSTSPVDRDRARRPRAASPASASSDSGAAPVRRTLPPVAAAAARKVPVSMRSGITRCSAPPSERTPSMRITSLPAPSIFAPIAIEAARQVDHLGLARRVLEHRRALGERRGHHQVLGAGDRDQVHDDARAAQPARARPACSRARSRSPRPSPAGPSCAGRPAAAPMAQPPGSDTLRLAAAREQRAEHQHRGAHGLHQLVGAPSGR